MNEPADRRGERVGTTIAGRFDVLAFARAGGMGAVYRARDRTTGATVALKMLLPVTGDAQRFAREAALLARIDHPCVVKYIDHGEVEDGEQYLAMEWLDGEDLADRLDSVGTLSVEETLLVARKTAAGLAAAHRAGIVHRDLKPANVFLVGGHLDTPKLLDFGVARPAASSDLTVTGTVLGTPAYMAPEQVCDEVVGPEADVYGVGAVLFRCLAGRAPFTGTQNLAVLAKVVVEPPPSAGKVMVTGEGRVGEVIDRAAAALAARKHAPGIHVDDATAELLEGRFRLRPPDEEGDDGTRWRVLVDEEENALPVRMLLGRPAACIGRDAQIAMLDAMLTACADDSRAGAALVVAEPGLGKTHLVNELLRPNRGRHEGLDVLVARGDPMRAASAFGMAAQVLARAAGIRDSDAMNVRAEKLATLVDEPHLRELLGEIAGVPTPPSKASAALRAARADASVMADALRDAWIEWMSARTSRGPVLVLLEDVHWADTASLRLLETTAVELVESPLFVLATSRPEGSPAFAERFKSRGLVEITLGPLSANAAEKLVRGALGAKKELDPETVRALCKRSAGHPFLLEELVRAVAEGRGADVLPSSVLGMMQARLDDLGATARQVLRAGSVFGETWRKDGVRALLGDEMSMSDLRAAIGELSAQEMIAEERAKQTDGHYRFRHALLRDAAYASLAEVDRHRAHRRAAEWLETSGELDPAVVGEHFDRGGEKQRAAEYLRRAAEQAMAKTDFDRALAHTQRALGLGPDDATEAALRGIEAEVLYWRGDIKVAAERAPSAIERLSRGSRAWLHSISVAVGALGQLGRNEEVAALLQDAAGVSSSPEDRSAHVVALCRGMTQLFWAHARVDLALVRACLDALVDRPEPLDEYSAGWVHRVHAESAFLHQRDIPRCLADLDASCAAFDRARAPRPLALSKLNAASLVGWAGDPARGLDLVRSACADAERLGAGFLLKYGRAVEGLVSMYARAPERRGDHGARAR